MNKRGKKKKKVNLNHIPSPKGWLIFLGFLGLGGWALEPGEAMREPRALFACVLAGFPLAASTSSIFPLPVYFGIPFILRPCWLAVFHLNSTVSTAHRLLLSIIL